mmetsp:Transcript_28405/g.51770  ORF Transcript_28405/g.51770 Transcript_28405/m.51770 type:complete len:207 (-) Transcript_28405:334-954(-)
MSSSFDFSSSCFSDSFLFNSSRNSRIAVSCSKTIPADSRSLPSHSASSEVSCAHSSSFSRRAVLVASHSSRARWMAASLDSQESFISCSNSEMTAVKSPFRLATSVFNFSFSTSSGLMTALLSSILFFNTSTASRYAFRSSSCFFRVSACSSSSAEILLTSSLITTSISPPRSTRAHLALSRSFCRVSFSCLFSDSAFFTFSIADS